MNIVVVDYRAGNLGSVLKALAAAGATPRVVDRSAGLAGAQAIVIPGVGHFDATRALDEEDRRVIAACVAGGLPLLGICLGMQWLFEGSDEAPGQPGLGVFAGRCARLAGDIKVPHVGWNTLEMTGRRSQLLDGLPDGVAAYFTHTYAVLESEETTARTTHGVTFASVVERGRVFGTQFHPERSGAAGVQMLKRFVEIAREANVSC